MCGDPTIFIHDIQGNGLVSPISGSPVSIEGIVVGDFQDGVAGAHGDLNGFFVQEEDADADSDPNTSEGIFVFDGFSPAIDVHIGDRVRVSGTATEFSTLTEINNTTFIDICASGVSLPTAAVGSLPVSSIVDFEKLEGMSITFPSQVIAEYFNFDRFGEIALATDRLVQPPAVFDPGSPEATALADLNARSQIILDDGRTSQNPDPAIHPNGGVFDLNNLFRGGDIVENVTGVMHYAFNRYRIEPTQGALYTSTNPRTVEPDPVGGGLKFASFNVLNYFSTLDNSGSICGPAADQGCRGADNAEEFTRQRDKIISAIIATGADVVGLIEIENHAADNAVIDLVAGLNAASSPGTWDYVDTQPIGEDVIKVAFIFKPALVSEVGAPAILDSVVDPRFNDEFNRPALAQTFLDTSNGAVFTLVINHLKSKGSSCKDIGDPDLKDGAGNCNLTRKSAAEAMVDWLATDPTGSNDADFIILGDLNSYDKEDPIDVFINAGYTDMAAIYGGEFAYGYVFSGAIGYLDYALASPGLLAQITGVTNWHINADEPDLIDYDTSYKKTAQDAIYAPDAYRSSDHDPVIGGVDLLQYEFGGFQPPVKAVPALNKAKAGQSIPIKFMLNNDYGVDILAAGYPLSQEIDCGDLSVLGDSEPTMSDGDIGLTYNAEEDQYKYVWKTSRDYKESCRQFVMQLTDGGMHYAYIKFK
jgi:predicted extracellular nuclease